MDPSDFIGEGEEQQDEVVDEMPLVRQDGEVDDSNAPENNGSNGVETMEPAEDPKMARTRRLIVARRKRRCLGQEVANAELEADLAAVKAFYALPEDEQEAYLACYEVQKDENTAMKDGLSQATTCGIRLFAARVLPPRSYGHITTALDKAEVRDGIRRLWEEFDLKPYADYRGVKILSALGAIADSVVKTSLQVINTAAATEGASTGSPGVPAGPAPVFATHAGRADGKPTILRVPEPSPGLPTGSNAGANAQAGSDDSRAVYSAPQTAPVPVEVLPQ